MPQQIGFGELELIQITNRPSPVATLDLLNLSIHMIKNLETSTSYILLLHYYIYYILFKKIDNHEIRNNWKDKI